MSLSGVPYESELRAGTAKDWRPLMKARSEVEEGCRACQHPCPRAPNFMHRGQGRGSADGAMPCDEWAWSTSRRCPRRL